MRDIQDNLDTLLEDKRVLLLGAGGAAMGAMLPLLECRPSRIVVANRTATRASDMLEEFVEAADSFGVELWGGGLDALEQLSEDDVCDVVINASSSSLHGELPPVPAFLLGKGVLAYDMMYGAEPEGGESHWVPASRGRRALVPGASRHGRHAVDSSASGRGRNPGATEVVVISPATASPQSPTW